MPLPDSSLIARIKELARVRRARDRRRAIAQPEKPNAPSDDEASDRGGQDPVRKRRRDSMVPDSAVDGQPETPKTTP